LTSIFEQLAQELIGGQPVDNQNWNQTVGSVAQPQFAQSASQAFRQVQSQDYYDHTQPGVGGTDPFGSLPPPQQSGLAQNLLNALFNRGVPRQKVMQSTGLNTLDPNQMSPAQIASLAQWIHQNHPEALGQVAAQYQQQPDILSRLMGNKGLMALGGLLGAAVLSNGSLGGLGGGGLSSLGGTSI